MSEYNNYSSEQTFASSSFYTLDTESSSVKEQNTQADEAQEYIKNVTALGFFPNPHMIRKLEEEV